MKPFGKIGIQIFSVIFLVFSGFYLCQALWLSAVRLLSLFHLHIQLFLYLCWSPTGPQAVSCVFVALWFPFFSSFLVLHLHVCPCIPCSYLADCYLENWVMSEANMIVLLQYFEYILGDYVKVAQLSLNLALPKFLNQSHL